MFSMSITTTVFIYYYEYTAEPIRSHSVVLQNTCHCNLILWRGHFLILTSVLVLPPLHPVHDNTTVPLCLSQVFQRGIVVVEH